jgi:transposase
VRSNVKVTLTVFFDSEVVVHHEFLPQGKTVTKEYCLEVMKRLREAIRGKKVRCLKSNRWILHADNAPVHTSVLIHQLLQKHETTVVPQPPYTPYLAPADFFIPQIKNVIERPTFESIDAMKENSLADLCSIPNEAFQKSFEGWKKRWERCIQSGGDYFESDKTESLLRQQKKFYLKRSEIYRMNLGCCCHKLDFRCRSIRLCILERSSSAGNVHSTKKQRRIVRA